ncbi:golgin subfamily A member 6-like protein 22 [Temnothorax curvispinosus]|uniref:Golgin subfamily A member 6-like protein 22 n=1 Tax=Temnothorax curvispinosus TaxID=300111 RepID=A0A6J1PDQ7_9HYME|nr:golgin subfamily A member 6-like protein 22 [Temnothorax curvispinosus]
MNEEKENEIEVKKVIDRVKEKDRGRRGCTGSTGSTVTLEELWKRKREELDKSVEEKEDIFKRSNITARSPKTDAEIGVRELREIIGEMREDFRSMREEFKKGFKEQSRKMIEEIKELRKKFREQEKRWREEREEMKKQKEKV